MKRPSLIGPLILILIGLVFLARNLRPDWISLHALATYWPFLLIAWGLLRLIEVVYWRITSQPLPRSAISGGEWVLVVLICILGSSLAFFSSRASLWPAVVIGERSIDEVFGVAFDYPIQPVKNAAKVSAIVVENLRGDIRITGSDVDEVTIGGVRTVRALSKSDADAVAAGQAFSSAIEGDRMVIRTAQAEGKADRVRITTTLELTVPRRDTIEATARAGDFEVSGMESAVNLIDNDGNVEVRNLGGALKVDLRRSSLVRGQNLRGKVEILGRGRDVELDNVTGPVTINGYFSGNIQVRNLSQALFFQSGITELRAGGVPGRLELSLGDVTGVNLVGPIVFTARSKDVDLRQVKGEVNISVERGDIRFQPEAAPSEKIQLSTRSGDIEVVLPAGAGFELDAATQRGQVENAFGEPVQVITEGQGAAMKTPAGRGPKIIVRTERGRITIRKG